MDAIMDIVKFVAIPIETKRLMALADRLNVVPSVASVALSSSTNVVVMRLGKSSSCMLLVDMTQVVRYGTWYSDRGHSRFQSVEFHIRDQYGP
jgi:hypothetical protein